MKQTRGVLLLGAFVTEGFFDLLGVPAAVGRVPTPDFAVFQLPQRSVGLLRMSRPEIC